MCPQCSEPTIHIHYYGESLIGCGECNLWRKKGEGHLRSLAKEDLEALNLSKARHKAEDTSP